MGMTRKQKRDWYYGMNGGWRRERKALTDRDEEDVRLMEEQDEEQKEGKGQENKS